MTIGLENCANNGWREGRAGTPLPAAARTECAPYQPKLTHHGLENAAPHLIHLWVEDRGPGIPPEEHGKIFERFYRRGSELRRETQGIGIGLTIVKHIVEAHGGRVLVRSAVGQGSRFTIELPGGIADCPDASGRIAD